MTPLSSTIIRDVGWMAEFDMAEFDIEFDKYSEHAMQLMSSLTGNGSPVYNVKYEIWDAVQADIMSGEAR